jgi:SSS family solute:Na+ symporter
VNERLSVVDIAILVGYLALTVGIGCWFAVRKRNADEFMAGGRSLPGWAVGLSMFGSYVSSISFLANPGKSFASNWNAFVFCLATPIAAAVAVRYFVPFYRRSGQVSAYEHLEHRFGPWARTYAVVCFLLTQVARTGTVLYLLALAVSPLIGWDVRTIIVLTALMMVVYTVFGGIEAAVWIGVLQSGVLVLAPVVCVAALLLKVPGGLGAIVDAAAASHKFGLGGFGPSLTESTFWVVLVFGLVGNLGNFSVDQSYVQRYITTPTEREARRSVWITAAMYVPVAAVFFFIGTALFALRAARPELFPAALAADRYPDRVFPYFISNLLPTGLSGLVVAGIFAASMDSSLSSMATLTLCDVYKRYVRPGAGERESLRVLHGSTLCWGLLAMGVALAMVSVRNVLDVWWEMAGVCSGGMFGLFVLGLISRRAGNPAAAAGVCAGVLAILWLTFSNRLPGGWPRNPMHAFMTTVIGTLLVVLVGLGVSRVTGRSRPRGRPVRVPHEAVAR